MFKQTWVSKIWYNKVKGWRQKDIVMDATYLMALASLLQNWSRQRRESRVRAELIMLIVVLSIVLIMVLIVIFGVLTINRHYSYQA